MANNNTSISSLFFCILLKSCSSGTRQTCLRFAFLRFLFQFFKSFRFVFSLHFSFYNTIVFEPLRQIGSGLNSYSNALITATTTTTIFTLVVYVAKKRFRSVSVCRQFQEFDRLISHSLLRGFSSSATSTIKVFVN